MSINLAAIANLDNRQLKAFSVVSWVHSVSSLGGINYVGDYKTLKKDALTMMGHFPAIFDSNIQESRYRAVVDWGVAVQLDATIGTDVYAIVKEMGELREMPENTLLQIIFFLQYKFAVGGA